jgi:hypothetical protein
MRTEMPPTRKDAPKSMNVKTGLNKLKLLESGETYKTTPRGMGLSNLGLKKGGIHIKESHKGLLHKDLGVPSGKPIPEKKLEKAEKSKSAAVRKRAVFAENAKHWKHT